MLYYGISIQISAYTQKEEENTLQLCIFIFESRIFAFELLIALSTLGMTFGGIPAVRIGLLSVHIFNIYSLFALTFGNGSLRV